MAVEIGTLVLKGRFGPANPANDDPSARRQDMDEALAALRREVLREIDDKMRQAARRAWER